MFCVSVFIHLVGIGEKPCAEHSESNSNHVFRLKNNTVLLVGRVVGRVDEIVAYMYVFVSGIGFHMVSKSRVG